MPAPCPACGYENRDDALVCNLCRAVLRKAEPAGAGVAAPPDGATIERWKKEIIALGRAGRYTESLPWIERVLAARPDDGEAWLFRANAMIQLGRHDEALAAADRCLALDALDTPAMLVRATALSGLGRKDEMGAMLDRAGAVAHFQKGKAAIDDGAVDAGLAMLDEAVRLDPELVRAWYARGVTLGERLGRPEEALACFERVVELDTTLAEGWNGIALSLLRLGRPADAVAPLRRALALRPNDWQAWSNLASALFRLGRNEEGGDALRRFLALAPPTADRHSVEHARKILSQLGDDPDRALAAGGTPKVILDRALAHLRAGRPSLGEPLFARALELAPDDRIAWVNRAIGLSELERHDDALGCLDRAERLDPAWSAPWFVRGDVLQHAKRFDEAVRAYDRCAQLAPATQMLWNNRGTCLNRMGKPADASASFRRAVEVEPGNSIAWCNLAWTEDALGRADAAAAALRRFIDVAPADFGDEIEHARRRLVELGRAGPAATDAEPRKGDLVAGRYQVHRELGRGAFGVVHLVYSLADRETYALKTVRRDRLAEPATRAAFAEEARVWVGLDHHPNIVRAHRVDEAEGRLVLLMELVPPDEQGRSTLASRLAHRPLDATTQLLWAVQLARGMEHAYAHGLRCHADLKPDNLLVTPAGDLKITDFGLAGALGRGRDVIAGTPTHMAPEQFQGRYDERTDVYAFGVVLFQMATGGRLPFWPKDAGAVAGPRIGAELAHLHATSPVPRLGSALFPLIARCMAKDPAARPQSFREVRALLEPMLRAQAGASLGGGQARALDAAGLVDKGESLVVLGRHAEALACFDEALAAEAGHAGALAGRARALAALGRTSSATVPEPARAAAPSRAPSPPPPVAPGNVSAPARAVAPAAVAAPAVVPAQPAAPPASPKDVADWLKRGEILANQRKHAEALPWLERAAAGDATNVAAHRHHAATLAALGRHAEAAGAFERALARSPDDARLWRERGASLGAAGSHDEALACLQRSLALDPRSPAAWHDVARSLAALRRVDEAAEAAAKALAIDARHAPSKLMAAMADDVRGRVADARRGYQQFLALAPPQLATDIAFARQRLAALPPA